MMKAEISIPVRKVKNSIEWAKLLRRIDKADRLSCINLIPKIVPIARRKEAVRQIKKVGSCEFQPKKDEILQYKESLNSKENKDFINRRKEIVEHPFGTIKRTFGYTFFQVKGIEKVKGEFSLICFVYNLKRVLNIMGTKELIEALV